MLIEEGIYEDMKGDALSWPPCQHFEMKGCTQNLLWLQQQGFHDTATDKEGQGDNGMEVCGPEDGEGSVGNLLALDSRGSVEDLQM